jgi:hypothetical protein
MSKNRKKSNRRNNMPIRKLNMACRLYVALAFLTLCFARDKYSSASRTRDSQLALQAHTPFTTATHSGQRPL